MSLLFPRDLPSCTCPAVGASWPTNPRAATYRRLASLGRAGADGYTALAEEGGGQEPEPVGIITIEDVIEELLQVGERRRVLLCVRGRTAGCWEHCHRRRDRRAAAVGSAAKACRCAGE